MLKKYQSRRLFDPIAADLKEKMVFLAGPRQCGKTTVSLALLKNSAGEYYNWDVDAHRKILKNSQMNESTPLWVFDELHKYRPWRNWLKGVFDLHHEKHAILVTGSAKLDLYRKGGDSLQGRYYLYRMHPFTLSEYLNIPYAQKFTEVAELKTRPPAGTQKAIQDLLELSGFPEPLLGGSATKAARWRLLYGSRLIQQDVRSIEDIRDLDKVELLFDRLPECVGSVLSINSLREDLEVTFPTAKNWIGTLEKFYACFRVAPFGSAKIKAVKKEQKVYLWNWAYVENEAARFENFIASHLLRWTHWLQDMEGEKVELRYFRNTLGQEVDFVIVKKEKPWLAIEVKLDDRPLDSNLKYFLERVFVPYAFQISLKGTKDYRVPDINGCKVRIMPSENLLVNLP